MRITIELLGWTLAWSAEQGADHSDHSERGEATSYPVAASDQGGEPYEARFGFGSYTAGIHPGEATNGARFATGGPTGPDLNDRAGQEKRDAKGDA